MISRTTHNQSTWLDDADRQIQPDALTEALDALYARGPSERAVAQAQAELRKTLAAQTGNLVYYDMLPQTSVGPLLVAVSESGLIAVDFGVSEQAFVERLRRKTRADVIRSPRKTADAIRQLREYLIGQRTTFDLPVDLSAITDFQRRVLLTASKIPRGQISTYADIARQIGRPKAARAVGQALGHNPVPIVIPCHRVLGSDGSLHGYSGGGGIKTKAWLLQLEGVRLT